MREADDFSRLKDSVAGVKNSNDSLLTTGISESTELLARFFVQELEELRE